MYRAGLGTPSKGLEQSQRSKLTAHQCQWAGYRSQVSDAQGWQRRAVRVTQHVRTGGRRSRCLTPMAGTQQQPPGFSLFPSEPNALHLEIQPSLTHPGRERVFTRMIL